jgi:flavin reductase (DIM6/NTAB) family NADH-FMN oxidoreductase RutF
MTAHDLDAVVDLLDYPMFVVTTRRDDERSGCLVGFASQVSINPRRFLVGLSNKNHTFRIAQHAERLVVHVLDRDDRSLAELFGTQTGDDVDKFAECEWTEGPGGVPVLTAAPAWFSGRILRRDSLGDHVGFLIEPDEAHVVEGDISLLTLAQVSDLDPGHDP